MDNIAMFDHILMLQTFIFSSCLFMTYSKVFYSSVKQRCCNLGKWSTFDEFWWEIRPFLFFNAFYIRYPTTSFSCQQIFKVFFTVSENILRGILARLSNIIDGGGCGGMGNSEPTIFNNWKVFSRQIQPFRIRLITVWCTQLDLAAPCPHTNSL